MIVVYAKCIVSGQNVEPFLTLAKQLVEETRKEPDNISYELVQCREGKNVFAFVEKWPSQQVLEAHLKTAHFTKLIPEIEELTIGKIDIATHELVL